MTEASLSAPTTVNRVMKNPTAAKSRMLAPMVLPPSLLRPMPICWPSRMVAPMEKAEIMPVMVPISCEPVETADTSAELPYCPTISRSTAPYMACKIRASRTGKANLSKGSRMGPVVKLFSLVCMALLPSFKKNTGQGAGISTCALSGVSFPANDLPPSKFFYHITNGCKKQAAFPHMSTGLPQPRLGFPNPSNSVLKSTPKISDSATSSLTRML